MENLPPLEPLLDAESVGRILGLHPGTVLRLARSGRLPALRYARHWHFRPSDITQWLQRQVVLPTPPSPPQQGPVREP